ncbi:hypothetical protein K7432_015190 [Basidiobolus ranarum]|uniref:Uncharacterized protein n=1 Tax=Basidiobolus ranarum TaxID=34480 RepID=A0ABR2WGJ6_9FUNG
MPTTYEAKLEMFNKVFDFKRLRLDSFQDLQDPNKKRKLAFSNLIRTDGFTADVVLQKSVKIHIDDYAYYSGQDLDISLLGNVMKNENMNNVSLSAIDPNRNQVFAASYVDGDISHQLRRCSTVEYYTYTGSKRHAKREMEIMCVEDMSTIFKNIPTAKTANTSPYLQYVTYILLHLQKILAFTRHSIAKNRFHLYQGVQRARQAMVNILVNGGRKYNKSKRQITKNRKKRKKE